MNYWIKGNDAYLIDQQIQSIISKDFDHEVEVIKIDNQSDKLSLQMILDDLTTVSLFTQRKLMIVYNPLFLINAKKSDEKSTDLTLLEKYYQHCDYAYSLMIVLTSNIDSRLSSVSKLIKLIQSNSQSYLIPSLKDINEKKGFILQQLAMHNVQFDKNIIDILVQRLANDGYGIMNQLNQLMNYPHVINRNVVDRLIAKPLEGEVFSLTNALNANQTGKAMNILSDLLIQNNQPVALIALIASNYRTLYQVACLKEKDYSDQQISQVLGINPKRLYFIHKSLLNKTSNQLSQVLTIFANLDQSIKNGEIDAKYGLELSLLKCKGVFR